MSGALRGAEARGRSSAARRGPFSLLAALAWAGLVGMILVEGGAACGSSTCPFPKASAATIDPAQTCLDAKVTSCIHATLTVKNLCTEPLYISTDYGNFPDAKPGQEVEVLPGSTITYEVREDKATANDGNREDYAIPGRVGPTPISFAFFIEKS